MKFDNGKYEIKREGDRLIAYRYGEVWRDLTGDNLIYWMVERVKQLESDLLYIDKENTEKRERIIYLDNVLNSIEDYADSKGYEGLVNLVQQGRLGPQ